jgi:hypothetical protein
MLTDYIKNRITTEMTDHFYHKMRTHNLLVEKYINRICQEVQNVRFLKSRIHAHDLSRIQDNELIPSILSTWAYHCTKNKIPFELTTQEKEIIVKALVEHYKENSHHPEYHIFKHRKINYKTQNTSAIEIPIIDLLEMCADWCALGEDGVVTNPLNYFDVYSKKWQFIPQQKKMIFSILNLIWK